MPTAWPPIVRKSQIQVVPARTKAVQLTQGAIILTLKGAKPADDEGIFRDGPSISICLIYVI